MSWNFRVYRHPTENGEDYLAIHEAYYLDKDAEEPSTCTVKPVDVGGTSIEELRWTLEQMLKALDKPVLEYQQEETP